MAITAAQLLVKIGADISEAERGMQAISQKLSSIGTSASIAGGILTAGLSLPLLGLAETGIRAATDLDREMRNIQSIGKQTDAEIAALAETFIRMSTDVSMTTESAQKLATGFYHIQSSGFAGEDAMRVLEASTKAASAGLSSTTVASKAITATLNAYGMSAEQATRVSDVLFRTVDIGELTFEELATQLGDIVGTGAIAKVPIEELGAALATMTKGGISAAESATGLNQLMLSFISPTSQAAKVAKELGIDLSATALQSKGLSGVMAEVAQKAGGNAEAMNALFPNVRALKAALSLTRGEMKPFAEDLAKVGASAGATQAAFEIQAKSLAAHIASFQNALQGLSMSLGLIVIPVLTEMITQIQPLLHRILGLDTGTKRLIVTIAAIAAAVGPALLILGMLASAFTALSSPIGLIMIAIVALATAWAMNLGGIRNITQQVFGKILALVQSVWPSIQSTITTVIRTIQTVITTVLYAIQTFWHQQNHKILSLVQTIWGAIQQFIDLTLRNIWIIVITIGAALQGFWNENGKRIIETTQVIWNSIEQIIRTIIQIIQMIWQNHGEQILHIAQNFWNNIRIFIETVLHVIFGIIQLVLSLIRGDWQGAWEAIKGIAESIWNGIYSIISNLLDSIKTVIRIALEAFIQPLWERVWGAIQGKAQEIWDSIYRTISDQLDQVKNIIRTTLETFIQPLWERIWGAIETKAQEIWDSIYRTISDQLDSIKEAIRTILETFIQPLWERIWNAIETKAQEIWDSIYRKISDQLDSIKEAIHNALEISIQPLWERIWDGVETKTKEIWDGIVGAVKGGINTIIEGINSLIRAWNQLEFQIPGFGVDIPSIDVPGIGQIGGGHLGWPGITIGTPDIPTIPLLGTGGIITRPALALLGEAGPEAILPLSGNRLDVLAEKIADAVSRHPTYTIHASYRYQDERSLRDDLRLLQMLGATV